MASSGTHFRRRHLLGGMALTRATHGSLGFDPAVAGPSMSEARDGEQTAFPDMQPGSVGQAQIQADVVIANVVNVGGTVTIDDTGISILEGALIFQDSFGNNVLTGAGFGTSWLDFLNEGFYNGHFAVGSTNDIVAATVVGTASTEADYLASLSADIPYWIVNSETGAGTLKRVADSTAVGGFALQWAGTETAEIFQDLPVVPGLKYVIEANWRFTASGASTNWTATVQFRKADHSAIGSTLVAGPNTLSTNQSAYDTLQLISGDPVPADARYMRVFFKLARVSGSPTVWLNGLFASQVHQYGTQIIREGDLWLENFDRSGWGVLTTDGTGSTTGLVLNPGAPVRMSPQGALARRSTSQSINNATDTMVSFSDSEDFDSFGFHSLASNQSRFTVPSGWDGTYLLVGTVAWAASAVGNRMIGWAVNGAADALRDQAMPAQGLANRMTVSCIVQLTAGDYVELRVHQTSGGALGLTATGSIMCLGTLA